MQYNEFVDAIAGASAAFADVVSSAPRETAVPTCPGWTMLDLTRHLGEIHRWACSQLTRTMDDGSRAERGDVILEWFQDGASCLVSCLRERDGSEPCSSIYPPDVTATWARRQALETALHLWDATNSLGSPGEIPAALAAVGVREVLEDLYPRQVRLGRTPPLFDSVEIRLTDVRLDGRAPLILGPGVVEKNAGAVIELRAEDALLALWKRRGLDPAAVLRTGSEHVLKNVLSSSLVP